MKQILFATVAALALLGPASMAAVPTPQAVLGHVMGEDRYVPSYSETMRYWKTLTNSSARIKLLDIGPTTEGRRQIMAVVSSPENLAKLKDYQDIAVRLGKAENLTDSQARELATEGKAIVWVDGGLHASEVEAQTALIQQVYDLVSSDDPEAKRIRDNVIILFANDNPDGSEYVADWYMRFANPADREANFDSLPKLYHPYIGHDNNRDFYMAEMPETQNISRVLYHDWRPQIMLNQHQTGPAGTVVFIPPFRDPFNYHDNPLIITSLEEVGAAINSRLLSEDKVGATTRTGAHYDTWTNGNLRTSTYFHNTIGLLVEIIGSPVPEAVPLVPERQLAGNDQPAPVKPQMWTMAQSVQYSLSMNRSVLTYAASNREKLLYNIYHMGAANIAAGDRDSWTITPDRIKAVYDAVAANGEKPVPTRTTGYNSVDTKYYDQVLHDPAHRDARAYIISPQQPDFPTAVRFLNALIKLGVEVDRSTGGFTFGGKSYPAGSYIVRTAQAYRPHILDMFEPQIYNPKFDYPGGPPIPPADASGYTLAYQMGVQFDRALDPVTAPTEPVEGLIKPYPGQVVGSGQAGFLISHDSNASMTLTSRLLKAGQEVYWLKDAIALGSAPAEPGTIWVPRTEASQRIITQSVADLGIDAYAQSEVPSSSKIRLNVPRIALFDLYGGLLPTGWTRWIFDQFEIPYTVVHPQDLDKGNLNQIYDVLLIPDSAMPNDLVAKGAGMFRGRFDVKQPDPQRIPAEYRGWLGTITADKTIPALRTFVSQGGTVIGIGSTSQALVDAFALPVDNALTQTADGKVQPVPRTKFYAPGVLLRAKTNSVDPLTWGLPAEVDLFFDSSPVFHVRDSATGIMVPLSFGAGDLVHSGWAYGTDYLKGAAAGIDASFGKGHVVLFGPEVALRGQTQGTFKLLFNGVYLSHAEGR